MMFSFFPFFLLHFITFHHHCHHHCLFVFSKLLFSNIIYTKGWMKGGKEEGE